MVKFWLLTYPRQNLEISLAKKLLGDRNRDNYRFVYQDVLSEGHLVVRHVTGEGKVKGFCRIAGEYNNNTNTFS